MSTATPNLRSYLFRRYIDGKEMAQEIEAVAATLEEAMAQAVRRCSRPRGASVVLIPIGAAMSTDTPEAVAAKLRIEAGHSGARREAILLRAVDLIERQATEIERVADETLERAATHLIGLADDARRDFHSARSHWMTEAACIVRSLKGTPPPAALEALAGETPPDPVAHLNKLATMKEGWDGYGALPLTPEALGVARVMLTPPAVVPLNDGGICFEWHQDGLDVEIEIHPRGNSIRGDAEVAAPPVQTGETV